MNVLSRFEQRLGGGVEGVFSRVFRSRVEPVELAVALKKEADAQRSIFATQTRVPNRYEIDLAPTDYDRLAPYRITLGDELAQMLREHADEQRYSFVGPVEVELVRTDALRSGSYRIGSTVEEAAGPPRTPPPSPFPSPSPSTMPRPEAGVTQAIPRQTPQPNYGRLELPDGQRVTLSRATTVLGRGHEADVRLADASVSRRHAEIRADAGRLLVDDLGSTNGTSVNGERIARAALLDGDRITLGSVTVVYRGVAS
jgi:hypothetical protein